MNPDECVCGHAEDEHSEGFLQECEVDGCDCPLYELYEPGE